MKVKNYHWAALAAALGIPLCILVAGKASKSQRLSRIELGNLKAFLLMLQYSEGTVGPNAYRKLYGGRLFIGYLQHPNAPITKWGITSTAAGAYQFLYRVWTDLQASLHLPDFSPKSQNIAAIELIRRNQALGDVLAGNLVTAIYKCRKTWASLPGAGYGQHENVLSVLTAVFNKAGGKSISQ